MNILSSFSLITRLYVSIESNYTIQDIINNE